MKYKSSENEPDGKWKMSLRRWIEPGGVDLRRIKTDITP